MKLRVSARTTLRRKLVVAFSAVHLAVMVLFVSDLTDRQQKFIAENGRDRATYEARFLADSVMHVSINSLLPIVPEFLNEQANSRTALLIVAGTFSDLILRLTTMTLPNLLYDPCRFLRAAFRGIANHKCPNAARLFAG